MAALQVNHLHLFFFSYQGLPIKSLLLISEKFIYFYITCHFVVKSYGESVFVVILLKHLMVKACFYIL